MCLGYFKNWHNTMHQKIPMKHFTYKEHEYLQGDFNAHENMKYSYEYQVKSFKIDSFN